MMTNTKSLAGSAQQNLILLAVCMAAAAMPLTFTGPAVALPSIAHSLGGSPIALNWVTNAFMLTFGSGLMAAGALADSYGRKRMFIAGVAAFALFSFALAFASGIVSFDLLRGGQGIAAAAAFSAGMASLAQEFDGTSRVRAFSIVGTSFGVGLAFGPIASGLMADAFGWRTIFYLVFALATASLLLAISCLRESRDPDAAGLDWPGTITFTLALTFFTYAVLEAPESGWTSPAVIGLLVGAALLMAAFVIVEGKVARPMLDLSLFRYPRFVGVQLLAAAPAYAFVVLLILLPIRFTGIEGMSAVTAGQMMIALSAPLLILPLVAGWLTKWLSVSTICGTGLLISAAGLLWLSYFPAGQFELSIVLPMLTIGTGISLPWGLMDGLAVSVVPKERAGMATGIFSTTRVAGEGLALAVVSAILSALSASSLPDSGAFGPSVISETAQFLATGNLDRAVLSMPSLGQAGLTHAFSNAFGLLLMGLAGVTVVTATVVFLFLGSGESAEESAAAESAS
jgi:MFS family permease